MSNPWPPPMKRDRVRMTGPGTVIEYHRPDKPPSRVLWFGIGFISALLLLGLIGLITS
jgi:hypothetical protein